MKIITKYQAYNGTEFTDQAECEAYEARSRRADDIIALLPPKPELPGCEFENGGGFLQHDRVTFLNVRRQLLELGKEEFQHSWFDQSLADESVHPSYVARLLGDGSNKQLERAWHRISCTDKQYREWGQPYYANNPDEGKQVCLNKPYTGQP
jgi:hypothetical protein